MHVKHLQVENLRSIASAGLDLNAPGDKGLALPNVNVLLGDNGAGKTTVLRAVALATLGPALAQSSGFLPENLIRRGAPGPAPKRRAATAEPAALARAELTLQGDDVPSYARALTRGIVTLETRIERVSDSERMSWKAADAAQGGLVDRLQHDRSASAFFVVGYGATRRVETSSSVDESARLKTRSPRYQRVAGLFEEGVTLMPLSFWLPEYARRNKGRYVQVVRLMNALLPAACRMQDKASDTPTGTEHLFEMNGVTLPFRALSDGYRAYIGWIGDMLYHVCMGAPTGAKLVETRGVVMVDEIDLHLHPEWQRSVVPVLARALPQIQFVITTHSPLVVGSLESANLFLLDASSGASELRRLPERVRGRTADQILLGPYFGLQSTRAPEVAEGMRSLAQAAAAGDAAASLAYLKALSSGELPVTPARARSARKAATK